MARGDWNTVTGSTNNNSVFFTGIRWRYRDDLFGTSGYPTDRISSNTDIIEYQPYVGKKSSYTSRYYNNWLTSYYKYSYNTTSGTDPASASNQLNISTTFRFDQASTNTNYYLTKGSGLSSNTVMNTNSSTTSRIIQVPHCSDGTSKVRLYFYFAGNSATSFTYAETNQIITLDNIPRYTSITGFTVSKRNETSLTFNWSTADIIDYVYYSTDNGNNWTGYDVTDGTSGSFTVSGLSPNTTYNCKLRVRRKDSQLTTDSSTVSQTTYKVPAQSVSTKTETSITMSWSCDTTADYIEYSTDNGSNWTAVGSVNATSGNYTISGLNANTSYNIKTRVRRSNTQTKYETTATSVITYQYPYISVVGTNALTIGNSQTLTLYNPLGRTVTVYMKKDTTSGTQLYSGTTNSTSISFTPVASTLYASIPSTQSGNCVYYCVYSSQTVTTKSGTYKIVGNEIPTFNDFSYKDNNTNVTDVTGNDQIMVKSLSTVKVTVSSANKMIANNSATPNSYSMSMDSLSAGANYSTSDVDVNLGTINASGTKRISVTAYDSRGLYKTIYKDVMVYDYSKPVINATVKRLNDFENETTLKVAGTYTKLAINNINKNSITSVQYRYRETGSNNWIVDWTNITTTVNNGNYTCTDVVLSLDNTKSFDFEIRVVDTLQETTTKSMNLDKGQAIFFISTNNEACYINGQKINNIAFLDYEIVDTW